jgi:hypothetical protein
MNRAITRIALLLLVAGMLALAACGGSDKQSGKDAKETLASVKPLPSAQTAVALRIFFDNAPASVGDKVELTFDGPLRNNGADKLPSLDWKVAFSGLATKFTSRIVSTGNNFFINLGGQDFEAGEQAVQQLTDQAQASKQKGLAQVGLNPLAAVRDVKDAGDRKFDGETLSVYKGAIDLDIVMDQVERLSQGLPTNGAAQTIPQGRLTPQQRGQVKRTFGNPRFEVGVADDDTVRQLLITSKFTTPATNREAAGGITGGHMEYKVDYTAVGKSTTINPPTNTQPMSDFAREVQRIVPTSTRFMWRMNESASMWNERISPSRSQRASRTSRSKRWW